MTSSRAFLAVPVLILALTVALLLWWRPLDRFTTGAPPVEEAVVESVRLTPGLISLDLRSDGSEPVVIAQVQVDGAYRVFTASPPKPAARLGRTRLDIPYPWIAGEAHHLALVTRTGIVFEHTIEVAQETPALSGQSLVLLLAVGLLLGAVPVATGLLVWPAMRNIPAAGIAFLLALTIGLLGFLLVDTTLEGLEAAHNTIGRLRGPALFWVVVTLTVLLLLRAGRRGGASPEGLRLAYFIALGIGLHNLGEGLAVGAALAAGSAALASYLVLGFTIHNVTEGIGIAAPVAGARPSPRHFIALTALAGVPAVFGTLAGTQAVSPLWISICFAIAAGAILQVMIEVMGLLLKRGGAARLFDAPVAGGLASGLIVMYATALLI